MMNSPLRLKNWFLKPICSCSIKKLEALTKLCSCGLQMQEDAELYNMKGRAEGKLGHMELKIQLTLKAILLNPKCAVYYRNLGAAQYKLQRYQSAIESHRKAAQLEPNNPINYHNAGAVYFRLKRYDQAIVEFKKSLQLNKYQAHSFRWLGNCFKEKQLFKEALECYYRAYDMSQKQIDRVQIEKLEKCLSPWRVFFNNLLFC